MAVLQPQLTLPAMTNIWPIVAHSYSSCCIHIINNDKTLDVSSIQAPVIISQGKLTSKACPPNLLQALISVKCLLSILSPAASETSKVNLVDLFLHTRRWGILQAIRPQTYIIVAKNDDRSSFWLGPMLPMYLFLHHLPEIFVIHGYPATGNHDVIFRIRFLCWYCGAKSENYLWKVPLGVFESSCSASQLNCSTALKSTVTMNLFDSGLTSGIVSHLNFSVMSVPT